MVTNEAIQKKHKLDQLEKTIVRLEVEKRAAEIAFTQAHGLPVDDLAGIEDEKEFYRYIEEFCAHPDIITLNEKIRTAEAEKRLIEDEFIEMAISLGPDDVAKNIRRFTHLASFRKDLIDTYLRHLR